MDFDTIASGGHIGSQKSLSFINLNLGQRLTWFFRSFFPVFRY